jgi:hypothetical protein
MWSLHTSIDKSLYPKLLEIGCCNLLMILTSHSSMLKSLSGEKTGGAGEPRTPPIASALTNAKDLVFFKRDRN